MYKTKQWERMRLAILTRDKFICQECKRKGNIKNANTVHHIKPHNGNINLFSDTENLISLCESCHNKMHIRDKNLLSEDGEKWLRRKERGLIKKI